MTDLYLIAHKVRGEPAFDCAERMECPECNGRGERGGFVNTDSGYQTDPCTECDSLGYWWIVGTSGHRAYPYWNWELDDLADDVGNSVLEKYVPEMPESLQDHYLHTASPATIRARLEDLLSTLPPTPTTPFKRRF